MEENVVKVWWMIYTRSKFCCAVDHAYAKERMVNINGEKIKPRDIRIFAGTEQKLPKNYEDAVMFIEKNGDEVIF